MVRAQVSDADGFMEFLMVNLNAICSLLVTPAPVLAKSEVILQWCNSLAYKLPGMVAPGHMVHRTQKSLRFVQAVGAT